MKGEEVAGAGRALDEHLENLPANLVNRENVLQAEKEWFEMQVEKQKWLNKAKTELLKPSDFQDIGGKKFIKKSGVKLLQAAFLITTQILSTIVTERDWGNSENMLTKKNASGRDIFTKVNPKGKELVITVTARAVKKQLIQDKTSGRMVEIEWASTENQASCSNIELAEKKGQSYNYHNILSTATTRALNRCVLDLLGGDVSFEEVEYDKEDAEK